MKSNWQGKKTQQFWDGYHLCCLGMLSSAKRNPTQTVSIVLVNQSDRFPPYVKLLPFSTLSTQFQTSFDSKPPSIIIWTPTAKESKPSMSVQCGNHKVVRYEVLHGHSRYAAAWMVEDAHNSAHSTVVTYMHIGKGEGSNKNHWQSPPLLRRCLLIPAPGQS